MSYTKIELETACIQVGNMHDGQVKCSELPVTVERACAYGFAFSDTPVLGDVVAEAYRDLYTKGYFEFKDE